MIENPNPSKNGRDKYLMIAKFSLSEELQDEDADAEASIKAFRQKGGYEKQEPGKRKPPWWTSANASKRAKEAFEHERLKKNLDEKRQMSK